MKDDIEHKLKADLEARRGEWRSVAALSGVSYSWLSQFARGLIANPGIMTIRKLRVALDTKRPKAR